MNTGESYENMNSEREPLLTGMPKSTYDGEAEAGRVEATKSDGADQDKEAAKTGCAKFGKHFEEVCLALSKMTIEPMLFIKMVAEGNFKVVADTLEIDRICRVNLNFSESDCSSMDDGNHTSIQTDVQRFQNNFNYHQSLMDSFIPLIVVLFAGPISDRYGRKPAMISVLIGFVLMSLIYTLTAAFENWPVQVLYLATFVGDICGTWVVFNMAVYSYISDITTTENRTKRMGIADAIWYMGSPVGKFIGGHIFKLSGYVAVYATSGALWAVCLLYTVFLIKESRISTNEEEDGWHTSRWGPLGYVISLFKTAFKKRPGNGRLYVYVLIGLKLGTFFVQGHQVYLWARKVLQWDATQYSTWSSAEDASHQFGMVGWIWFAERHGFHDCFVAAGGLFSIMLWAITLACISGPSLWWLVIVASTLGLFEGSIEPALRSMLTAVVGIGEEGRVLTLLGLLESAWLSVDNTLYTYLYNKYIETFYQINYVVEASIAFVLIIVVLLLKRDMTKPRREETEAPGNYICHSHDL